MVTNPRVHRLVDRAGTTAEPEAGGQKKADPYLGQLLVLHYWHLSRSLTPRISGAACPRPLHAIVGLSVVFSLDQSRLLIAVVAGLGDDDVVKNPDAEYLGGLGELLMNGEVGIAGLGIAGWVVVGEDDGGGAVGDYIGEDFARMNLAPVEQADGYGSSLDNLVRAVHREADEMLLCLSGNVG